MTSRLLTKQPDEAARELRLAVAVGPDSALAHPYLGRASIELQKPEEAVQEFREVWRLAPRAENHPAAGLMSMGLCDQALAELETAARMASGQHLYGRKKRRVDPLDQDRSGPLKSLISV